MRWLTMVAGWAMASLVFAQDKFPSKPILLVAPLPAGNTSDMVARAFAERLTVRLGQPVSVQNRPGAGGTIAAQSVAKAAPDGYTFLIVNSQHSINTALYSSLPYDTLRDFSGLAQIGEAPSVIAVHPKLGVKTLVEFIVLAKERRGQLSYGSSGVGTTTHLGGAYLATKSGVEMLHVPYKGAELMADLLSGRVDSIIVPTAFVLQPIRDGRLIAIGVTSSEPLRAPLELPAVAQTLPGFEYSTYYGFVMPAKAPAAILAQLSQAIRDCAAEKEMRERLAGQVINYRDRGPVEFDAFLRADIERIGPVVRAAGAKAD
jgi:tripartite-type tricarboxylate transporter receptor subunit TctC